MNEEDVAAVEDAGLGDATVVDDEDRLARLNPCQERAQLERLQLGIGKELMPAYL